MDGHQFDTFTRILAAGGTRRRLLRAIGGLSAGVLVGVGRGRPAMAQTLPNGEACTESNQCDSGYCVDGACCDGPCTEACEGCNVSPVSGTCSPSPFGWVGDCPPPTVCNGLARGIEACCAPNGTVGSVDTCCSGFAPENVCCDTACDGPCETCTVDGAVGTCVFVGDCPRCVPEGGWCGNGETCCGDLVCNPPYSVCLPPGFCIGPFEGCSLDDHCCDDLVCIDELCVEPGSCVGRGEGCTVPEDCCRQSCSDGVCVAPGQSCTSDSECGAGFCCEARCFFSGCCIFDADPSARCPEGTFCSTETEDCEPINCSPEGESCTEHRYCCDGLLCSHAEVCVASCLEAGQRSCSVDDECCVNLVCIEGGCFVPGACVERGAACEADDECCRGICCGGVCVGEVQCCIDDPIPLERCPVGTACVDGFCEELDGDATVTVHLAICTTGVGPDIFEHCHDVNQIGFVLGINGVGVVTDANGAATAGVDAGMVTITFPGTFNNAYLGAYVYCSEQHSDTVMFDGSAVVGLDSSAGSVSFAVSDGDEVICDWYNLIPSDDDQDGDGDNGDGDGGDDDNNDNDDGDDNGDGGSGGGTTLPSTGIGGGARPTGDTSPWMGAALIGGVAALLTGKKLRDSAPPPETVE